jgi:hypothetical protein
MRYCQAFCRADEVSKCSKGCRDGTYLVCRLLVSDEGSLVCGVAWCSMKAVDVVCNWSVGSSIAQAGRIFIPVSVEIARGRDWLQHAIARGVSQPHA